MPPSSSSTPYYNNTDNNAPIVVQGQSVVVASQEQYEEFGKPQHQRDRRPSPGCRDAIWAVLFYAQLGVMATVTVLYAPQVATTAMSSNEQRALAENDNDDDDASMMSFTTQDLSIEPRALAWLTAVAGVFGCILSSVAMGFMIRYAETLIKTALVWNILVSLIMALGSLLTGLFPGALVGLVCAGGAAYYAYRVWTRVPFAAVHLVTAITAVRAHAGLVVYAYLSLLLLSGWTVWWTTAAVSTMLVVHECDGDGDCQHELQGILLCLFLLSYYWTAQVLTNVVHVTVAGTVGSWWWDTASSASGGCCSSAVRDSYRRSLTTSFGSICLGSLVVAVLQTIRTLVQTIREQQQQDGMFLCVVECLIGCIESLVKYFNKWAFVYVGLYGSSFMESGRSVMTLFQQRGWTSIITDLMVDTVLALVGAGVGLMTGLLAVVLGAVLGLSAATWSSAGLVGFALGFGMSSVLFSVVSSAVNTVVVCYAEAPQEFHTNHPALALRMRGAWREAFPSDFNY